MKPKEVIKYTTAAAVGLFLGRQAARRYNDVKQRREAMEQEDKAAEERRIQHEQQNREKLAAKQLQIDTLNRFAGRLVLIINPRARVFDRAEPGGPQMRAQFADAITDVFAPNTPVTMSNHAPHYRGAVFVERDLAKVVGIFKSPFSAQGTKLERSYSSKTPSGTYSADERNLGASLADALQDVASEEDSQQGHIAVVDALAVENVGLDPLQARYGNAYVLQGVNDKHDFSWHEVFNSVHAYNQLPESQ